jgi:predicted enzyme related to lactoylglutathione lyase
MPEPTARRFASWARHLRKNWLARSVIVPGFYQQLFDWKTNDVSEMNYTMVETGGDGGINGGIGTTPQGAPGGVTFYVHSDDVAGSLKCAEELGGRTVAGPMDMPDGHKWALFADPEGHVVGLYGRC